jgi:hypothetical protein
MPTLSELFEMVESLVETRVGVLYHGTNADSAADIIVSNRMAGTTEHNSSKNFDGKQIPLGFRKHEINKYDRVLGVSLTRNPAFARAWTSGGGIVFGFDAEKLKQRFRIVPYDYYGNRREAEEFLIGELSPVSSYLVSIEISQEIAMGLEEDDANYLPGEGRYSLLLAHPLLRVNGQEWHNMSGKITYKKAS